MFGTYNKQEFFALIALVICAIAGLATPSYAQEESPSHIYAPEGCDFTVTFPSEPEISQQCEGDNGDKCHDLVSFTHVFDMNASVNFRIICSPVSPDVYAAYSPEIMQTTLETMTDKSVIRKFDSSFREEDRYKQASLIGEGKYGRTPTIYIAQLWIAQNSAFSVEAQLIGEAIAGVDEMFSDVLKSVGLKQARLAGDAPDQDNNQDQAE